MNETEVTCITKPAWDNRHEAITALGGPGWYLAVGDVITNIRSRRVWYFVQGLWNKAYVEVVNGPNGAYVRTHANGQWTDNLLHLRQCR